MKNKLRFNYKAKRCRNAALPLNGMHLNIPSTEFGRFVWPQADQTRPGRAVFMRGRSPFGQSSWYLAIMTRPVLTNLSKDMIHECTTHPFLWYLNFIAIPSFVRPKLTCIRSLISLNNDRHLFAGSFVTVGPIAMKFGWGFENVRSLRFRKFHLHPSNFTRKWKLMFKLDFKKITLTAFRHPVQNGSMHKVKIFWTGNDHQLAFYAPTKNRTDWMRASCYFFVWKKSAITLVHENSGLEINTETLFYVYS